MKPLIASLAALLFLCACAVTHPDHFYVLQALPAPDTPPRTEFGIITTLKVSLPSLVDRSELVLRDADGVTILEHERWGAPLTDQVAGVLGRDLEQRRPDVLISSRRIAQPGEPTLLISIDIADLSVSRISGVSLETRWRLESAPDGLSKTGRETFRQPLSGTDYAALVQALSACVAQLADRLQRQFPATVPQP